MIIRLAKPSDAEALYNLNLLFNGEGVSEEDDIRVFLEMEDQQEIVCVAEEEGKLLGFCCGQIYSSFCYKKPSGEITEFFVEESSRGQGVGKKLLAFMDDEFERYGVSSVRVLTGSDNFGAQKIYQGYGYELDDDVMLLKEFGS